MENLQHTFKAGEKYEMHFICNSDLKPVFTCVKRTAKNATFQKGKEILTRKIRVSSGCEYVLEGVYSMAPSIDAKHVVR